VTPTTSAGLIKFRPVRPGSRVAVVAPASPFNRDEFDAGIAELRRIGLDPVYGDDVFERRGFRAGPAEVRAGALARAWSRADVDAIVAVRGGYGSIEVLPLLDAAAARRARTAFIGYSDLTAVHIWLGCRAGVASVHGPMLEGRLARGEAHYDADSLWRSLGCDPAGEYPIEGVEALRPGEASGPIFGGTLTQILASLRTPFEFTPPAGYVLLLEDAGERPYRIHRMLTQMRLSGLLSRASAIVFGQMPGCDEPGGAPAARDVVAECLDGFPGPVLFGFPTGHATSPCVSVPLGVHARVVAAGGPRLVIEEAAAAA
jgi:muramoyltetrapeptide carboxypeptidase